MRAARDLASIFGVTLEEMLGDTTPHPRRAPGWDVAIDIIGNAPAGLAEDLQKIVDRYKAPSVALADVLPGSTTKGAVRRDGAEKMKRSSEDHPKKKEVSKRLESTQRRPER